MGRRPDSSLLTTVCWPFNGLLGPETQFRPVALWGCYWDVNFYFIGCEEVAQETGSKFVSSNSPTAGVTVIWAFPRFGHPHSQNPNDIFIPCSPNPNLTKVIWEGDSHIIRVWGMGMPKRGDAHITVTPESHGGKLGRRLHIMGLTTQHGPHSDHT